MNGAANNGKPCPTGFGFGIAGGGNADAAVVAAGASATGSLGAGLFHNSSTGFSGRWPTFAQRTWGRSGFSKLTLRIADGRVQRVLSVRSDLSATTTPDKRISC